MEKTIDLFLDILATLATLGRVFITIVLSVVTGWLLAYGAIKNKIFENIYISLAEVFESVPVISFFPVVLIFFVYEIGGGLGVELAVIFLVFTAAVWNIWMGIYQAFKTVPEHLVETVENYKLGFLGKMSKLYIPFSVPRIAANLIPSFADALFYITVSEVFTVGVRTYQVFGIGTLISNYVAEGDYGDALVALGIFAVFTTTVTLLLREFASYSVDRYGLDTEDTHLALKRGRFRVRYSSRLSSAKAPLVKLAKYVNRPISRRPRDAIEDEEKRRSFPWGKLGAGIGILLLFAMAYSAFLVVRNVTPSTWAYLFSTLPQDLVEIGVDYLRVAVISLASLVIAIFAGYWLARSHLAERIVIPIIQSISAFPAPAYFPLLYGATYPAVFNLLHGYTNEFYVLLLGFISTFYYVFYSYWLGVRNMPHEYWELMDNLKLSFWQRMTKVVIPSAFPYIIAGLSSTVNSAWGGLAIGEYWPDIYNNYNLEVRTGLMKELAIADANGQLALVGWLSLIFAIIVVAYSILFTRRLMDLARKKYVAEEGIYSA
ncbi:MAG: sugar ABC transporter permease [Candidatus Aramenus sulfurataquae]|jgi:NitT/TauT family transport system permease protein|uniref:ABC transporter permease subunit n=2 Tax=Candidatus Aramenus sulfurataquae TaxID=1326980 RepID=W7KX67_9CREN|nr:MAG: sugar ABC transporter permease [Candidatus Aramenus sulfurataquae]MCL7344137.1 ABC transporter permease subunit [Candidatus Aramenus sulfurataquae]